MESKRERVLPIEEQSIEAQIAWLNFRIYFHFNHPDFGHRLAILTELVVGSKEKKFPIDTDLLELLRTIPEIAVLLGEQS